MNVLTERKWVTLSAVQDATGLQFAEVRKLVDAGEFTTISLGARRRTKIDMASVDAYLLRSIKHAKVDRIANVDA
jgi:hypothetical protein